jgi:hypothetical protein
MSYRSRIGAFALAAVALGVASAGAVKKGQRPPDLRYFK